MRQRTRGFSLIELMIVVAIIAVLSAIALPLLSRQQTRAAETACLAETRTYLTLTLAALSAGDPVQAHPVRACIAGDSVTPDVPVITARPRPPGSRRSMCAVATANCALEP